jgi:hypothetical protein
VGGRRYHNKIGQQWGTFLEVRDFLSHPQSPIYAFNCSESEQKGLKESLERVIGGLKGIYEQRE